MADVIATLGNSKQSKHFSFLKKDRFWGKTGEPARHFTGTLTWRDESTESRPLNETPSEEKAELVRYIPQGYFEELCNEHVSGKSNAFEKELRSVIFSHASEEMRLGALDFDQLTEQQEQSLRNRLGEYRKELASTNADIVRIEEQLQPIELKKLTDLLLLKGKQIEEHNKLKPAEVAAPTEAMSPEQKQAAEGLAAASQQVEAARKRSQEIAGETTELAKRQKAIGNIREQLRLLQRSFDQAEKTVSDDVKLLGFAWNDLAAIVIKTAVLDEKATELTTKQGEIKIEAEKLVEALNDVTATQQGFTEKLNAPQQQYEAYQRQLAEWNTKRDELIGSITEPETKVGLETRIEQIKELPQQLRIWKRGVCSCPGRSSTPSMHSGVRAELFKPVQDLIQKNILIREDYRLQFQATLAASADAIADQLFALIKQTSGIFADRTKHWRPSEDCSMAMT